MSSIKDAFKPTTTKNTSSRNPKWYNNEKNLLIGELATDSNAIVRMTVAKNTHTPTKVLVAMLATEQDKSVLRAAIVNDNMPRKAVAKFINDDTDRRVEWFDNDTDLADHFKQ